MSQPPSDQSKTKRPLGSGPITAPVDAHPVTAAAGGLGAIVSSLDHSLSQMGAIRSARTLLRLNQTHGFDCPGCAWPDPDPEHRSVAEFCENGVKAVADEATLRRLTYAFFAEHSISDLLKQSDYFLNQQGRLTEPLWRAPGSDHYQPITWADAFTLIAKHLNALPSPDAALFYTSGRTSNEAAFLYQLFVRLFGTNNLPDCSNMCHESSGYALKETIGIGKGTVTLDDFSLADCILVIGQNPGTNHPRMLSSLQEAARRGCQIVSINPIDEAALVRFKHPQEVLGMFGSGTPICSHFLRVRINGDVALMKGLMKVVLEAERTAPGSVLDHDFIQNYTAGFEAVVEDLDATGWGEIERGSGLKREEIEPIGKILAKAERVIACWAMGITQHVNGVHNVQSILNLLMMRGNLGRPGAGVCPVRGHSNVQGDRTMGIWERPEHAFLERLGEVFHFQPPYQHGLDVVGGIEAMLRGEIGVFLGMGGNFLSAAPETEVTAKALQNCKLTAHISTKLNRSHLITGREALILPCLGRTERDVQASGEQIVTVENSMGVVHGSRGRLAPASEDLLSEVAIVGGIARAVFGEGTRGARVDWEGMVGDYGRIRERIGEVIGGFEGFNEKIKRKGGFVLPNGVRDGRRFDVEGGRAKFTVCGVGGVERREGEYVMMTIRSHDQYNTTVYGLDDRYRGVFGERRVVLMSGDDMAAEGWEKGTLVDVSSGEGRVCERFMVVPYGLPRGCVAMYFPEANVLVPLEHRAEGSRTPASKSVAVKIQAWRVD
jgi:molybdopterin-dependent oxidoreductase alpha subunit